MSLQGPAAARLYDDHIDAVYSYVARRLGPENAIPVVGRAFEHALRAQSLGTETVSPDDQRGWLLGIATTQLREQWPVERERLVNWDTTSLGPTVANVSDPLLGGGSALHAEAPGAMAAVAELEPAERDLLFLHSWEQCDQRDISIALEVPSGTVRSRLNRIRKEIKRHMRAAGTFVEDPGDIDETEELLRDDTIEQATTPSSDRAVGDTETVLGSATDDGSEAADPAAQ